MTMIPGENRKSGKVEAKRILVVRYRFIGDTILTVPFLRNLRNAYPNALIDVLVGPQSGEVLQGCPFINELITFDTTRFHKYDSGKGKARSFWSYVFELRKKKYDTVFLLKRSFSSAALSFLIGARNRIGYESEGRSFLLTHTVDWDQEKHEVLSTFDVLTAAGVEIVDDELEAWISDQERAELYKILPPVQKQGRKVLFHAAAAHPDKMYPLEHWAKLIKTMHKEDRVVPYFTGAPADVDLYKRLEELSGVEGVNTAGILSLRLSMALLAEMDLAICTDSGPAHLSAAVGTPTIALFGPTDPERWRPWGSKHVALYDQSLPCRPCNYKKTCDERRECLTELKPETILQTARKVLQRGGSLVR